MSACERGTNAQTLTDLAAAAALRDFCNGGKIRAHVGNISYRSGCSGELLPSVRLSVRHAEQEADPEVWTKKNNTFKRVSILLPFDFSYRPHY